MIHLDRTQVEQQHFGIIALAKGQACLVTHARAVACIETHAVHRHAAARNVDIRVARLVQRESLLLIAIEETGVKAHILTHR